MENKRGILENSVQKTPSLQKGYDPVAHGLPQALRSCECGGCIDHSDWICDAMCARPFLSENGTECTKCLQNYCGMCSIRCGSCARTICRVCDLCPMCECCVCSLCVPKTKCDVCAKDYCTADINRCFFPGDKFTCCGLTVCNDCGIFGEEPVHFEGCAGQIN